MSSYKIRQEFSFLWRDPIPNKAVVAGRGLGKTVASVQWLVDFILKYPKESACGVFFASIVAQVTNTVVPIMRSLTEDWGNIVRYNKNEHKYSFYLSKNDIREIHLMTYENPDSKRGMHPQAIVLDECGSMPIYFYGEIVAPMRTSLDERLLAIGTARQDTQFHKFFSMGTDSRFPTWASYSIKASDCNILPQQLLEQRKLEMTEAQYRQEYECDFEANVFSGSVYGEILNRFAETNISDSYEWDATLPVWVCFDLGNTDDTAMWFFQVDKSEIRFIDYFEGNNHQPDFYANYLQKQPYTYAKLLLPHDGANRVMNGPSIQTHFERFGFRTAIIPKPKYILPGVYEAQTLLKTAKFKKSNCSIGISHLQRHKYEINRMTGKPTGKLAEDDHIHACDAFRYVAISKNIWGVNWGANMIIPQKEYDIFF